MIYNLALSVLFMAALYVILKFFAQWKVYNLHGLLFNYITASGLAFYSSYSYNFENLPLLKDFGLVSLAIGLLFITVFYITAMTAQTAGVATATVASKMSVVIPILFGVYLYHENITAKKISGTVLALVSVYLVSLRGEGESDKKIKFKNILLPFLLFAGAGIVDTSIKFSQQRFVNSTNDSLFVSSLFGSAALFGLLKTISERRKIEMKSIVAGIFLGVCNYFSLYFLLKCLASPGADSGMVFTLINIGVVLTSIIASFFFFREKPDARGIAGIVIAIVAIYILL